jgi:hypothetical protein
VKEATWPQSEGDDTRSPFVKTQPKEEAMSSTQPPGAQPSSNTGKIILTVVIVLVIVCVVIPVCVIAILAIMGPQIGNIFSRITSGVGSPMN